MKLLRLLRENPELTIEQVATKCGVNRVELRNAQLKEVRKIRSKIKKKKK